MNKILVADDEPLARESIVALLRKEGTEAEILQAQDGEEALEIAWTEKPELVFLDIQMPGITGIQVAEELPENTVVVFSTAYDEYAVKAFELNAVDYLLKPFKNARFYEALAKAEQHVKDKQFLSQQMVSSLANDMQQLQPKSYKSRLVIKEPKRVRIVDVDQVKYITGAGNYAELHLFNSTSVLYRETLSNLEQMLNPDDFRRIHRSTIVRLSCITELQPNYQGDYSVLLGSEEQLLLSRRYKDNLEDLLN